MNREQAFESFKDHAWLCKVYKRLDQSELTSAREFLQNNSSLTKAEFEHAVNRMFIDKNCKPRRWAEISELLICANSTLS